MKAIYGIRQCAVCGSGYKSSHGNTKCCSPDCSVKFKRQLVVHKAEQHFGEPLKEGIERRLKEGQSLVTISLACGFTSNRALGRIMDRLGIPRRTRSEAVKTQWKDNEQRRIATAKTMRETVAHIDNHGNNNPAKRPEIREKIRLSKIGPKNAMYGKTGSQNTNWRGGKVDYRGGDWIRQRGKARERDCYRCQHCGKNDCVLEVHHKVPYRVSHDNRLSNLITLCQQCHNAADTAWKRAHLVEQRRLRIF